MDFLFHHLVDMEVDYYFPVLEQIDDKIEAIGEKVIKNPDPYVRFIDFGDNSLIFDLYFWIGMVNLYERKRITSEIRFHIDELFISFLIKNRRIMTNGCL